MVEYSINYAPYTLIPKSSLSSKTYAVARFGALLRVEDKEMGVGFADCHPWPELGDFPLDEQLKLLAKKQCTPLTLRSMFFAGVDASFRNKKISCFEALSIPPSHFLISDLFAQNKVEQEKFVAAGGKVFKCKIGRDLQAERVELENLAESFSKHEVLFRLDSNYIADEFSCHRFMKQSSERLIAMLDFWEDPFPYQPQAWENFSEAFGVFLARDRDLKLDQLNGIDVLVLKPALQDITPYLEKLAQLRKRVVLTSYLDHPLGQVSAALVAARAKKVLGHKLDVCGLLSHFAFEENEFSECLKVQGPNLLAPKGTGFGFDELLAQQDWKPLC